MSTDDERRYIVTRNGEQIWRSRVELGGMHLETAKLEALIEHTIHPLEPVAIEPWHDPAEEHQ